MTVWKRLALVVAAGVGAVLAGIGWAWLTLLADRCPDLESEGASAAPDSPYAAVMCVPDNDGFAVAWLAAVGFVVVVLVVALLRARRLGRWALTLLLGPALLVGVLHLVVPQECLSGRTESGDCARDREQF